MVELRDALRPFVEDAAAAPRRPVAELAARAAEAQRRRIRRRTAGAGLAVVAFAALAVVGTRGARDPSDDVSTVEPAASTTTDATPVPTPEPDPGPGPDSTTATTGRPPSTTAPATPTPTTTATTAPPPAEPGAGTGTPPPEVVALADGVEATARTTSAWEDGYCVEVRVENTTGAPVAWQVRATLDGTINTLWNAVSDSRTGEVQFTGDTFNRELAPGAWTTFGSCVDT